MDLIGPYEFTYKGKVMSTLRALTMIDPATGWFEIVQYDDKQAIFDASLDIGHNEVIALIGPSGCGKSTYLRALNRMNDTIPSCRVEGQLTLDGEDIYAKKMDPVLLRARVGMVFQKPNPFPKSIYDNVAYGPRIHGLASNSAELDEIVIGNGGRHYLAKDARMSERVFKAGYANWEEFAAIKRRIDPTGKFASMQSERIGLTTSNTAENT